MARLTSLVVSILCICPAARADWPHPRGPWTEGRADAAGLFDGSAFDLDVAWSSAAGSGYSGIAIADGKAVTLFGASDGDFAAAFDAATGKELWRYRLGDPHRGIDGSHDGPLSSPVLGGGKAYVLAPDGRFLALAMKDGAIVWEKQLATDLGGRRPHFGFTTTPVLAEGVLVVLNGGPEGRSVVGLDPETGATRWSFGDDEVDYQSPAFLTLAGAPQLVVPSATELLGMRATTGDILWRHPLGERDRVANANPSAMGDDRFLVDLGGGVAAFQVEKGPDGFSVQELYRSRTLGGNYAPPVYHDGYVYGFRGQILTCMKAEDGERVWRSREPGGDGLLLADDHLVIFGSKGNIVVAKASPEGFQEEARVQALDGSSLTWPSFSDGRIFVRNLEHLAAITVTPSKTPGTSHESPGTSRVAMAKHSLLSTWIERIQASEDPNEVVDEFEKALPNWPLVDGDRVHFLYRGPAQDVAILGSMLDSGAAESLLRVPGTDLFYATFELDPASRWEYIFQVDFEKQIQDPRNPRTVPGLWGRANSEVILEGYPAEALYLEAPESPRGSLETIALVSKILGYEKDIQVWVPAEAKSPDAGPFPLLLVQDGDAWLEKGMMANTLENLVGGAVEPVIVAFIKPHNQWWIEAGGSRTDDYIKMLADELVPALEDRYPLAKGANSRAVLGARYFGLTSAYAALSRPETFGKAAIMSPQLSLGSGDALNALVRARAGSSVALYLDWNRFGERQVDRSVDATATARELAQLLESNGYSVQGGEVVDSFGWGSWRNRSDRVLTALFPAKTSSSISGASSGAR